MKKLSIDNAETIRALAADEHIDRDFSAGPIPRHILRALSYKCVPFPHMTTRNDPARLERHENLWEAYNAQAPAMAEGPEELEPLARWIRKETNEEVGIIVQNIIGRFFKPDFHATPESWQAALILHEAAVSTNPFKQGWWRLTGKVERAKALLGAVTGENLVAMHGIAVAAHNLVASAGKLRSIYPDHLTPDIAVEKSLSAPPVVYRQCPFSKTLYLLKLKDAGAKDLIFMSGTWSRCPAEQWIPAVIAGTWKRVLKDGIGGRGK